MSLTDTTPRSQTERVSFELALAHPPERVWRALTDPALLARWLLPAIGFDPTVGASFRFQADPQPGWDGRVDARVLAVEPLARLSYAWAVGPLDTVVTFTLVAVEGGTRLTVVQTGFREDQKQNFGGARYGWRLMGERLTGLLAEEGT